MKINYVTIAGESLGSLRYQLLNPAKELEKLGHKCVFSVDPLDGYDVYVFHKHFRYAEQETIKLVKGKTVFAVCDYHFDTVHRDHYIAMCKSADMVIAATNKLAEYIKEETGKTAEVIYDPWGIEFKEQKPRFEQKEEYVCLWFGHKSNIEGLKANLENIRPHKLMIVTNIEKKGIIPYNITNLKAAFNTCDVVIIPQDINDPRRISKTHNRIVDSFRAGRFVIASPVDSYLDFKEWAYLGDLKKGLEWLQKQSPEEIEARISGAQEYIRKNFDPAIMAKQWEAKLTKLQGGECGKVSLSNN